MKLNSVHSAALAMVLTACARQEGAAPVPAPNTSSATPATSSANVVECHAKAGPSTIKARFELSSMTGTLMVDGAEPRRFAVSVVPHSGTYIMLFASYGEGDKKPVGEKLVVAKSIVARLVADSEKNDLYFDVDVQPAGVDKTASLHCTP